MKSWMPFEWIAALRFLQEGRMQSLLIIVGVGLETVKQIDAQLQQRHYEGLLR